MRGRLILSAAAMAVLSAGAVGLVVAQDSAVPQVQSPPDEAAPPPGAATPASPPAYATDDAGLPKAPVPYTTLGPKSREQGASARTNRPRAAQAAPAPLAPGELAPTVARPRHTGAIIQAVDKVTAETLRFEAQVGKPVRYKTLIFNLRACESQAADELVKESAAHLTITSEPKAQPGRVRPDAAQVFRGWMFASSPGLNPFEHTVYDAWLVTCTPPLPEAAPALVPTRAPAAPRTQARTTAAATSSPG